MDHHDAAVAAATWRLPCSPGLRGRGPAGPAPSTTPTPSGRGIAELRAWSVSASGGRHLDRNIVGTPCTSGHADGDTAHFHMSPTLARGRSSSFPSAVRYRWGGSLSRTSSYGTAPAGRPAPWSWASIRSYTGGCIAALGKVVVPEGPAGGAFRQHHQVRPGLQALPPPSVSSTSSLATHRRPQAAAAGAARSATSAAITATPSHRGRYRRPLLRCGPGPAPATATATLGRLERGTGRPATGASRFQGSTLSASSPKCPTPFRSGSDAGVGPLPRHPAWRARPLQLDRVGLRPRIPRGNGRTRSRQAMTWTAPPFRPARAAVTRRRVKSPGGSRRRRTPTATALETTAVRKATRTPSVVRRSRQRMRGGRPRGDVKSCHGEDPQRLPDAGAGKSP